MWRGVFLLTLAIAGCRHAPLSYTLIAARPRPIVKPPIPPRSEIVLPNARHRTRPGCGVDTGFATLHWKGKTGRLQIHDSVTSELYADSLRAVEDFRSALFERSSQGCFNGEERVHLLQSITERAALPSLIAYLLRFGTLGHAGFVELTADFRLKVVGPLGSGVQVVYYSIAGQPNDDRVRLDVENHQTNPTPLAGLPAGFGYIRVLFWTSLSSANHYAALLAAPGRAPIEEATRAFQTAPEGSCTLALPLGVKCIPVPANFAVNAELRVQVNGQDSYVGIGATLAEVLGRRTVPEGLQVYRMYAGQAVPVRFNPEVPDILQLVLLPGDAVRVPQR